MRKNWYILVTLLLICGHVRAVKTAVGERYIAQWRDVAIEHENEYGIPAAITLAQGLLESGAGQSELAQVANNHFGIKCTRDWMGATYSHDDDNKGDCFRRYSDPTMSWIDHAKFLQRDRYLPCFEIPVTDYAGWARQLRACGYATDPAYAQKLITIIEEYELATTTTKTTTTTTAAEEQDDFFKPGVGGVEPQPDVRPRSAWNERRELKRTHPVRKTNGRSYVIAKEGDTYASIAFSLNMKERTLRKYNDALGRTLRPGDRVYYTFWKRGWEGNKDKRQMWVHPGESVWFVAQREGIRESKIRKWNGFDEDVDIFTTRQQIWLQKPKQ